MEGTLYLVATPIGNLDDMTARACKVLAEADIIAAEDTRRSLQLLNHFDIKTPKLVSYHEHNKEKQGEVLLQELLAGKSIALVTDAGFPGISDPGEAMADLAVQNGIKIVPVPGANACLTALVASGLQSTPFFFGAFLPKSKKNRREQLQKWRNIPATIVLYEAPHRITDVLKDILKIWGDRRMALGRELTKMHEEFMYGSVSELLQRLQEEGPRGEFVLVIEAGEEEAEVIEEKGDPMKEVIALIDSGVRKKDALKQTAEKYNLPKRELYNKLEHMTDEEMLALSKVDDLAESDSEPEEKRM